MKLEFGNIEHIKMLKEGERIAKLLEKDYLKARRAEEHDCNCPDCFEDGHRCPECGCGIFEEIKDCEVPDLLNPHIPGLPKRKITRRFCQSCEAEVLF